jgi:hypothetical protein
VQGTGELDELVERLVLVHVADLATS